MKTILLSNSEVEVSILCPGTIYFDNGIDKMSYRLLVPYVEAGGSFLDTTNINGGCQATWAVKAKP